jgi:two-component sensor histidine kinase
VISQANESSPQGRAYITGEPVIIRNIREANNLALPEFYAQHGIMSTVDVVIPGVVSAAYGVLEVDSPTEHQYDEHDINFLTGFANVLAEAVASATKNSALRALLLEKELLAEELQHRVRNNLQMVGLMLANYAQTAADDTTRKGIGAIVSRVMALATVYDSLLGVGLSHTIDLGSYLSELCASLPELQNKQALPVKLVFHKDTILLGLDSVTALGMAVAELVTNSYGHAFPGRAGTIVVTLARTPHSNLASLTIRDNGIGFEPATQSKRHGIGLVSRLMAQVGGSFKIEGKDGTLATLIFPVPASPKGLKTAA